ncbi:MAG: ABC transporter substrate-binding protein [Salinisphaera sp.]|nr:ABC transporter substrate-binding protein [Salinisphaera sp.]
MQTLAAILLPAAALLAVGCDQAENSATAPETSHSAEPPFSHNGDENNHWPVTVHNGGRTLTFTEAPKRVVAMSQGDAELMVALGLKKQLVGYAWVSPSPVPTRYSRSLEDVPVLAENMPSREVILAANPDFIIGTMRRSRDLWAQVGIKVYEDTDEQTPLPIKDRIYKTIRDISRIFGVAERGRQLIHSMQSGIDAIAAHLQGIKDPVNVLVLSGPGSAGATAATFGPHSLPSRLVELAGGNNVFGQLDDYYVQISWEKVIAKNPDVLVLTYCCGQREGAKNFIASKRALQSMSAVRNGRYVLVPIMDLNSMMRFLQGLQKMARGFYPDRFRTMDGDPRRIRAAPSRPPMPARAMKASTQ